MKQYLKIALAAIIIAASGSPSATNLSFTGSLANDSAVPIFSFTLGSSSTVTVRTWSYAGGTNAAGTLIAAGGFDPIVSLFFGAGNSALLINASDDGLGVAVDPVTGFAHDSLLGPLVLPAGAYLVALSEFDNFANGPTFGDGFLGFSGVSPFDGRTGRYAVDILGLNLATVPEPATLALLAIGLAAVGSRRRRRSEIVVPN